MLAVGVPVLAGCVVPPTVLLRLPGGLVLSRSGRLRLTYWKAVPMCIGLL